MSSARHGSSFTHFSRSSFFCCRGQAEHRVEPNKPIHEPGPGPEKAAKLSGLPVNANAPISRTPSSCSFLERLPLELRLQIYRCALGSEIVHLVDMRDDGSAQHESSKSVLTSMIGANWDPMKSDPWEAPNLNLALLHTCRQIYNEAADILYSSNTFVVDNIRAFIYLAEKCLSPQRLLAIKHLQVSITWRFNSLLASYTGPRGTSAGYYDFATWWRFWRLVANDMRLTSLNIELGHFGLEENVALDAEWMKPVLEIKGIRHPGITIEPAAPVLETFPEQAEVFRQRLIISMSRQCDESWWG